jgi:NAD-dependent dihydropyrimidine dehydrogenase PreA subunit
VFSHNGNGVVEVSKPYECNVGDESCKFQCPLDAISFPTREELKEMLRKVRAKYEKKEA